MILDSILLENTFLLDGRNCFAVMELVGLYPLAPREGGLTLARYILEKPPTGDPYAFVLSANVHRRHLTGEQKRELIGKVLKAQPDSSNRRIARAGEVDHKTVGSVRDELEGRGEIPHVETRQDSKGRQQPARKPAPVVMAAADRAEERAVKQQAKAERRASREEELAKKITALPSKQYGVLLADRPGGLSRGPATPAWIGRPTTTTRR